MYTLYMLFSIFPKCFLKSIFYFHKINTVMNKDLRDSLYIFEIARRELNIKHYRICASLFLSLSLSSLSEMKNNSSNGACGGFLLLMRLRKSLIQHKIIKRICLDYVRGRNVRRARGGTRIITF